MNGGESRLSYLGERIVVTSEGGNNEQTLSFPSEGTPRDAAQLPRHHATSERALTNQRDMSSR